MLDRSASLIALFTHTRKKALSDRLGRGWRGFRYLQEAISWDTESTGTKNTQTKPPKERSVAKPLGTDKALHLWQGHPHRPRPEE